MNTKTKKIQEYSTDGKVRHLTTEEDINDKMEKIEAPQRTNGVTVLLRCPAIPKQEEAEPANVILKKSKE